MAENIVPLPKPKKKPRVSYRGLCKSFRRLDIERHVEPVRDDELKHYSHPKKYDWYTARYDGPGEDYREAGLHKLRDLGLGPALLVYRVLRDLYGRPDNIAMGIPEGYQAKEQPEYKFGESPLMKEWGWMLAGEQNIIYEIRNQPGTQEPYLATWVPTLMSVKPENASLLEGEFKLLVRELRKTLELGQSLINKSELKGKSPAIGPINTYNDLLQTGDDQLLAVKAFELTVKAMSDEMVETTQAKRFDSASAGGLYMGAAIQYLLALEGFVNLVTQLLRKREFRDQIFDRLTNEIDFESRLLSISIFCNGFECAPVTPESSLFKRIRELRSFRNEILHGKFSNDDHVPRLVVEDGYFFVWLPAAHEMELATSNETRLSLPLVRGLFRKPHAELVRREVVAVVDAIIGAMEPAYRQWAEDWRSSPTIPAALFADGWRPHLN